tara:strand:+ start:174 stop:473 length:300 start_codon:yes stop_codon:yes gene_type:complete
MNKHDIDKLVRWSIDSDLKRFAEDAYGVTGTAFDVASNGEYLRDKFRQMQTNFIMWISGLDNKNRIRLARKITFGKTEEVDEHYEDIYTIKAVKLKGEK